MIDLNRFAPLTNPKLVGETSQEAEEFRATSNNFVNNQVSSTTREFISPDDDYECCPNCNRKFFSGRLQLHLKSCKEGKPLKPIKGKPLPKKAPAQNEPNLGATRATETTPRESQRNGSEVYQEDEEFEPSFGNQRKSPNITTMRSPSKKADKEQDYDEHIIRGNNRGVYDLDNEEEGGDVEENSPNYNNNNMEENENPPGDDERVPCGVCGRNFHPDRVEKHEKACKKSNKKRPVFDTTKQRMAPEQGELGNKPVTTKPKKVAPPPKEKIVLEATNTEEVEGEEQKKKVPAWKAQHDNFIKNIQFNRKLKEMEAKGEDTSHLVAPTMANDDYVPCPYCSRKFAPATAERHIPKCKNTFNRPKPPKALKIEKPEDQPRNERIDRSKTQFILRKNTTSMPRPEKGDVTPTKGGQGNFTMNLSEKNASNRSPQSAFSTGNYDKNMEDFMKGKSTPTGHRGSLKKTNSVEYSASKQGPLPEVRRAEANEGIGPGHEIKMPERRARDMRSQSPGGKEEKKVFMEAMPKKEELLKNYQGVAARSSQYSTETCPHCQRKFATHAAERHIPVCKSQASRISKKNTEGEVNLNATKAKMFATNMGKTGFRNRSGEREDLGNPRIGQTGIQTNYEQFPGQEKVKHTDKPPLPSKKTLGDTDGYNADKPPLKPKMFSTGSNFCTTCGCKSLKTHKFCGNCGNKKV